MLCRPHSLIAAALLLPIVASAAEPAGWQTVETEGRPTARHEAALVGVGAKLLLLGGRRVNPTDMLDTESLTWTAAPPTPIELHHVQPVVLDGTVYLLGAMTGGFPTETPLEKIITFDPAAGRYAIGEAIPEPRRRGGAGAVAHDGRIYLVGGIVNGHLGGSQPWLDRYDPATGDWEILPDAPHARDHFQAAVIDGLLYAAGGRRTADGRFFEDCEPVVDVFDIAAGRWLDPADCPRLPTPRAGGMTAAVGGRLVVAGGESGTQVAAHSEVEAYDPATGRWQTWPPLRQGRHGTGLVVVGDRLYVASGCGNRGGSPELHTTERLALPIE